MRTPTERMEARRDVMAGTNDHDVTIAQAILELCTTIEEASERIAAAHGETARSIDAMNDFIDQRAPRVTVVR